MMMAKVVAAILSTASPWYGLTVGAQRANCVTVTLVEPDPPAGSAGLRDDDCVARVNAQPVQSADDLWRSLQGSRVGETTTVELSNGRIVKVRPTVRSAKATTRYCKFVSAVRSAVRVFFVRAEDQSEEFNLSLTGQVTLAEVRKLVRAEGPARVVLVDKCRVPAGPPVITDDPDESSKITDGSVVYFGYDNVRLFRAHLAKHPDTLHPPEMSDAGAV